jgi:hypothetical protein
MWVDTDLTPREHGRQNMSWYACFFLDRLCWSLGSGGNQVVAGMVSPHLRLRRAQSALAPPRPAKHADESALPSSTWFIFSTELTAKPKHVVYFLGLGGTVPLCVSRRRVARSGKRSVIFKPRNRSQCKLSGGNRFRFSRSSVNLDTVQDPWTVDSGLCKQPGELQ